MSIVSEHFQKAYPGVLLETVLIASGEAFVIAPKDIRLVAQALKSELGFDMLLDIVAVDYKGKRTPRFEVDYLFLSTKSGARAHFKVPLPDAPKPAVDCITDIYPSANWAEREIWDMMGIHVNNHPNLRRILMWTGFEGHPLRKDYPVNKRQPLPILDDLIIPEK